MGERERERKSDVGKGGRQKEKKEDEAYKAKHPVKQVLLSDPRREPAAFAPFVYQAPAPFVYQDCDRNQRLVQFVPQPRREPAFPVLFAPDPRQETAFAVQFVPDQMQEATFSVQCL